MKKKQQKQQDFEQHIRDLLQSTGADQKPAQGRVSQNLRDAQREYEETVAAKRGIGGGKPETPAWNQDKTMGMTKPPDPEPSRKNPELSRKQPEPNRTEGRHPEPDRKGGELPAFGDAVPGEKRSPKREGWKEPIPPQDNPADSGNPFAAESFHAGKTSGWMGEPSQTSQVTEKPGSPQAYDYTQRQTIQDAQKDYEREVAAKRGYQAGWNRAGFPDKTDPAMQGQEPSIPGSRTAGEGHPGNPSFGEDGPPVSGGYRDSRLGDAGTQHPLGNSRDGYPGHPNPGAEPPRTGEAGTTEAFHGAGHSPLLAAQQDYEQRVSEQRGLHREPGEGQTEPAGIPGRQAEDGETFFVSRINEGRCVDPSQIRRTGIDLSELYEQSARGGEAKSEFTRMTGASEEDLKRLLSSRNFNHTSGKRYRIAGFVRQTIGTAGTDLYENSTAGTDPAQGIRVSSELSTAVVGAITDRAKKSMVKAMRKELGFRLNKKAEQAGVFGKNRVYIANPELGINKKELEELERELDSMLAKSGMKRLKGSYVQQQSTINRFLKKNKEKLTATEAAALRMRKDIAKVKTMEGSLKQGKKKRFRQLKMKIKRYLQQSDAGLGAVFLTTLLRRSIQVLRTGMRLGMKAARMAALSGKLVMRGAAQAAARLAKTQLAQKLAQTKAGEAAQALAQGAKRGAEKAAKHRASLKERYHRSRLGKIMDAFQRRHERFRQFTKDPFSLKKRRRELLLSLKKSKAAKPVMAVAKPIQVVKSALGYLLSGLMAAASALMTVLLIACALFLVIAILVCVIAGIVTALIGAFDFSANEDEIIEASFAAIKECYDAQNQQIADMNDGRYRSFTIQYETVKDFDLYNQEDHKPEKPFVETTNSAELLCMATVYFDFDLEEAGKTKVVDYVKKLYNGSHLLSVVETPYTYTDEEGNEYTVVDANATLTTYYFNDLFECSLTSSSGGVLAGTEVAEQVWNYFRSLGFSEQATAGIMGNLYQESGMDPTRIQNGGGPAAGICQWENYSTRSGRWGRLNSRAQAEGKSWTDLKVQLDFLMWELQGGDTTCRSIMNNRYGGLENFKHTTDVAWAVEAFERSFERAGKPNMSRRITQANAYYNMYKGREIQTDTAEESAE